MHLAIPLLVFEMPQIKERYKVNRWALLIGSLLPDIVDKSLEILFSLSGRGYAHTLLFTFVGFLLVFLISRGNKAIAFPFLAGLLIHLLLDMPYVPLFYPFIYEFTSPKDAPVQFWLTSYLTNPDVYMPEIIAIVILLFIALNNKLYSIPDVLNYLKANQQNTIEKRIIIY